MRYLDYREMVRSVFRTRGEKNPSYSLRAFSRDIGISPTQCSLVLAGKRNLSVRQARLVAERLDFNEEEKRAFLASVESVHEPALFS